MDYKSSVAYLYGLQGRGIKLGLERLNEALAQRAHPEKELCVVHVAGTNGKGSTVAFLESMFREAGYKTGLFTSPHLQKITERIRIDGKNISDNEFAQRVTALAQWMEDTEPPLSFFECIALLAFEAFRDARCDIVFLETGLGGRLDASNVVDPKLCIITNVALDHMHILGDTLGKIAREKAGILKTGIPCVLGSMPAEARRAIEKVAKEKQVQLLKVDEAYSLQVANDGSAVVAFKDKRWQVKSLGIAGEHQCSNAALALVGAQMLREKGFSIDDAQMLTGLMQSVWPGRLERISKDPEVIVDAAHNTDGARVLRRWLEEQPKPTGPTVLLFSCMQDKASEKMLDELAPCVEHCVFTSTGMPRAENPETLAALCEGLVVPNLEQALEKSIALAGVQGRVIVAGSIFLIAEARRLLMDLPTDPLIAM